MRTMILLLDWDSTLFWRDAEGTGRIDEATLPISAGLLRRLNEYYKHYSELHYQDEPTGPIPDLENRLLDDTGLEIWQQLRKELDGVYRVRFHSQEFRCSFESPQEFIARRKEIHSAGR